MNSVALKKPFKILYNIQRPAPLVYVHVDQIEKVEGLLQEKNVHFTRNKNSVMAQRRDVFYILNFDNTKTANLAKEVLDAVK